MKQARAWRSWAARQSGGALRGPHGELAAGPHFRVAPQRGERATLLPALTVGPRTLVTREGRGLKARGAWLEGGDPCRDGGGLVVGTPPCSLERNPFIPEGESGAH